MYDAKLKNRINCLVWLSENINSLCKEHFSSSKKIMPYEIK